MYTAYNADQDSVRYWISILKENKNFISQRNARNSIHFGGMKGSKVVRDPRQPQARKRWGTLFRDLKKKLN
jgi:hypothetical protein